MERIGQWGYMDNRDACNDRDVRPLHIRPGVLVAVWTAPALLACFQRWASAALSNDPVSYWRVAAVQLPGWYLWAAMTPAIFLVANRFPLTRELRGRAIVAHVVTWSGCLLLHSIVTSAATRAFDTMTFSTSFTRFVGLAAVSWLPSTFLLYAATVGVALWMQSVQRERLRERQGATMSVQLARAELTALRSQLHPHFLFNTLNTIAILIRERETEVSARLVTQLGEVLRHVIYGTRTHENALDDEIALVSTYLEIEQVRFGERLKVKWMISDDVLDASVPALVLQPLVENALRHGIANHTTSGVVEIGARRDLDSVTLWIADNGPGIPAEASVQSTYSSATGGLGLTNTRERLARLYPGRSSLELLANPGGGTRAEIHLPFRSWSASSVAANGGA